jgi:hypothetical protein
VTEDEFYAFFQKAGFKLTGESTNLTEEWVNDVGTYIMVPRPSELSDADRASAIERAKMYLGIKYPPYGRGVH